MIIKQLYIDGEMHGPSYGSMVPGPQWPTDDDYSTHWQIRNARGRGLVLAEGERVGDRERVRVRDRYGDGHAMGPWVWRDTIRWDEYFQIADRCDGKGTAAI